MSFKPGRASSARMEMADPRVKRIIELLYERSEIDFTVVDTFRDKLRQDQAYRGGFSGVEWPNSKHNINPSPAWDVAPYRNGAIDWEDIAGFKYLARETRIIAGEEGIGLHHWPIRFMRNGKWIEDLPHHQLSDEEMERDIVGIDGFDVKVAEDQKHNTG